MTRTRDVFVSYSNPDKECALAIVAALEARGMGVWVAPRDVSPAGDWAAEIVDAIAGARLMVLVFSAHSNDSPQVRREVERAVHHHLPVLPFRIEDVLPKKSLEYFLSAQHWLDAFPGPLASYYGRLAEHCAQLCDHSCTPQPSAAAVQTRMPSLSLEPVQRQRLENELAAHVGPIARLLIARATLVSQHWQDLVERLATEIVSEEARRQFLAASRNPPPH